MCLSMDDDKSPPESHTLSLMCHDAVADTAVLFPSSSMRPGYLLTDLPSPRFLAH